MNYVRCLLAGMGMLGAAAVATAEPSASVDATLNNAKPGQVVEVPQLNLSEMTIPVIPVKREDAGGPQFLLSDKPEYFRTGDGVSLRERVEPGLVRLYVYHVPEPTGAKKVITAVIDNLGDEPMSVRFVRYAFPKPSGHYRKIGKLGLVDYMEGEVPENLREVRTVAPGGRLPIDPALEETIVSKDDLVHGFYEFEIDQPGLIRVFQRDPEENSLTIVDELPELPQVLPGWHASGAGRGLFLQSEFYVTAEDSSYTYDTTQGAKQIIVADGNRDPWITGRDSIAGEDNLPNKGNYGVFYHIRMPYHTSDGRSVALLAYNPRSGGGCDTQSAALKVSEGRFPGGIVMAPADAGASYGTPPEAVLLQVFPPSPEDREGLIELTFSPPGASCLPVGLVLVPIETP